MSIPRNDETPDFCTIRHLLPYIFVAGIKGGYIFPTEAELLNPPSDGIFRTFISYDTFAARIKHLTDNVLKLENLKITPQTIRKTGYLFAVLGSGDPSDMRKSARHKSLQNAKKYRLDAMSIKGHIDCMGGDTAIRNKISKWQSIHIEQVSNIERMSFENKQFSGSLWELANRFVGVDLNISKDHPNLMHPKFLLQKSMDYTNKLSNSEQLLTYCTSQLNNVQSETIMASVSIVLLYFYQNFNTFTEFLH